MDQSAQGQVPSVAKDAQPELAAFLPDGTCPKAQGP